MKIEEMTMPRALELAAEEPFAYITRLSQVEVGRNPKEFSLEELLEVRFFGPRREIRIFREDESFHAVMLEEEEGDVFLEKTALLRESQFGRALTLRQYIVYDADGQGSIQNIRLVNWEEYAHG